MRSWHRPHSRNEVSKPEEQNAMSKHLRPSDRDVWHLAPAESVPASWIQHHTKRYTNPSSVHTENNHHIIVGLCVWLFVCLSVIPSGTFCVAQSQSPIPAFDSMGLRHVAPPFLIFPHAAACGGWAAGHGLAHKMGTFLVITIISLNMTANHSLWCILNSVLTCTVMLIKFTFSALTVNNRKGVSNVKPWLMQYALNVFPWNSA